MALRFNLLATVVRASLLNHKVPIPNHVPAQHVVIFGASISNRLFDSTQDRQTCYDAVQAATGQSITIYELADEGFTTTDFLTTIDSKIAGLSALPRTKAVKVLIHLGGNNVSNNRPYTSAQDSTVIATMLSDLNTVIDKIEAQGWDWMLNRLSFRDYNNACWDDESLGSLPYNQLVIDVINAARGTGHYLYSDGCPWGDYYTWVWNNNVRWLQYDNVHPNEPEMLEEWRQLVISKVLIPWVTGIEPSRIAKVAWSPRPTASISVVAASVTESGTMSFDITLSAAAPWPCKVTLAYTGTAVAGTDYAAGPTTIYIPAGDTSYRVTLQGINNATADGNKTTIVTIGTTGDGYTRLAPYTVTGTWVDEGTGGAATSTVQFAAATSSVSEGATASLSLTASPAPTSDLTVNITYTGTATAGSDYTATATVTIPSGQGSATLSIPTIDDATAESAETIIASIASGTGYVAGTQASHTVTIGASDQAAAFAIGDIIHISLGDTSKTSAHSNVNLYTANSAQNTAEGTALFSNLVKLAGGNSDVSFTLTTKSTGSSNFVSNATGLNDGRSYEPYVYAEDLAQSWAIRNNNSVFTLAGLPAGTYRVVMAGLRNDTTTTASTIRTGQIAFSPTGTTDTWDAGSSRTAGTSNWYAEATDVAPDGSGNLVLTVGPSVLGNTTNYAYFGALSIERLS